MSKFSSAVALILLFCVYVSFGIADEEDQEDLCPPRWPKYRPYVMVELSKRTQLIRDESSGCMCKDLFDRLTVCFGRDSCRHFPKFVNANTTYLRLKNTKITRITPENLDNFKKLKSLDIEANAHLKSIEPGTFRGLELKNLSISYNSNLKRLDNETFDGLFDLEELFLINNGFTKVLDVSVALSKYSLPKLLKLSLSENSFKIINQFDFISMNGSTLQELNLVLCQTEYMHPDSLLPLKNLRIIRMGENRFNSNVITDLLNSSIQHSIPLKVINLYALGYRTAPPKSILRAISNSNITHLCLAKNQFEVIASDTFPSLPNVEILDLREVLALNITKRAFKDMPKLRTLLLSGNKLSSIPDGVLLEQLSYLDLSDNSGDVFLPSYFSVGKKKFSRMKKLKYLNLSYNQISTIYRDTFSGLINLRVLVLKNATLYHLEEGVFAPLKNLVFLNLENNFFMRNSGLDKDVFGELANLEVLLLGGCGISNFSENAFQNLTGLVHLGLENNQLLTFSGELVRPLEKLTTLDISQNFIPPWQERLFESNQNLTTVLAAHNKFSYFSTAMLNDFARIKKLDVSGNPFACDCLTFLPLKNWLEEGHPRKDETSVLKLMESQPGFCVYPDEASDETLAEFFETMRNDSSSCSFQFYKSRLVLFYVLPVVTLLAIFLGMLTLMYMYRWKVRYWIFLLRLNVRRYGSDQLTGKLSCTNNDYAYDAFVSYSNEDCNFVVRLVSMLESHDPFLKLCVYERDFQIGAVITEAVLDSVAKSRKTLLIISDSYARSQWCRWEVQIAEHHRIFLKQDIDQNIDESLIMIKLGDVSDIHLTPTLKYLMKTRIYLQWDSDAKKQKIFWDKLRKILAPPKVTYVSHI